MMRIRFYQGDAPSQAVLFCETVGIRARLSRQLTTGNDAHGNRADHFKTSALSGQPAMITASSTVRTFTRCLIALYRNRHEKHPLDFMSLQRLNEDDMRLSGTTDGRTSAGKMPQGRGKKTARMRFDICGLIDWLRCRYPRATAYHVEADTGIPAATVDNWLQARSTPALAHFTVLIDVYGPTMLEACYTRPTSWITEAAVMFKRRELAATITRLQAQLGDASNGR